ncbi:hypothetical protein LINGRAHAP2_LOCUS5262 [Linum grandiflorum]
MESEYVTWLPFGAEPIVTEVDSAFRGAIHFGDTAEWYDPASVLRQLGYVQDEPNEIRCPSKCIRGFQTSYVVTWDPSQDVYWRTRGHMRIMSMMYTPCSKEQEVEPGYLEWYLDRTHLHISRTLEERHEYPMETVRRIVVLMLLNSFLDFFTTFNIIFCI